MKMKRVMIVGQPGSGKSTFARALGERIGLPVIHIDKEVHWKPGWIERSKEEKARLCHEIHAREEWIFEGGHSTTWPERLERADTLIWLDYPLWLRMWRVNLRTIKGFGRSRDDLPENCPENYSLKFWLFIWRTRNSARENTFRMFESVPKDKNAIRLIDDHEVKQYLESI